MITAKRIFCFVLVYFSQQHQYPEAFHDYDYSIIKLRKPFILYRPAVNPVCLPPPMKNSADDIPNYYEKHKFFHKIGPLKIIGWGKMNYEQWTKILHYADKRSTWPFSGIILLKKGCKKFPETISKFFFKEPF